jgi:ribonuclease VapC
MFIDASVIVAILAGEPDAAALAKAIDGAASPITSAIAIFEATVALKRQFKITVEAAELYVSRFLAAAGIDVVAITADVAAVSLDAFKRYGKGQGHPAQLNMGDCFAYAAAKTHRTSLLYKGGDFSRTDLA